MVAPLVHYARSTPGSPEQIVTELRRELRGRDPALLLCFVSTRVPLPAITTALSQAFPGTIVAGCTTCGEIGPAGCTEGGVSIAALLPPCRATAVLVPELSSLRFEQGDGIVRSLASALGLRSFELRPSNHLLLTLPDGMSGGAELLITALTEHAPGISLVGGSAGDDFAFEKTLVAVGSHARSDAAVVVLIEPNVPFHTFHLHHYTPTGRELVVTDAEPGRHLVRRLDGYPARRVLAELLAVSEQELCDRPQQLIQAKPPVFGFRAAGSLHLRSVLNLTPAGELMFAGAVEIGTILHHMRPGDIVAQTEIGVAAALSALTQPAGLLLFNCGGRSWEVKAQNRVGALAAAMQAERATGFTTYGEQFGPLQVNHTLTGLVLGRTDG